MLPGRGNVVDRGLVAVTPGNGDWRATFSWPSANQSQGGASERPRTCANGEARDGRRARSARNPAGPGAARPSAFAVGLALATNSGGGGQTRSRVGRPPSIVVGARRWSVMDARPATGSAPMAAVRLTLLLTGLLPLTWVSSRRTCFGGGSVRAGAWAAEELRQWCSSSGSVERLSSVVR